MIEIYIFIVDIIAMISLYQMHDCIHNLRVIPASFCSTFGYTYCFMFIFYPCITGVRVRRMRTRAVSTTGTSS